MLAGGEGDVALGKLGHVHRVTALVVMRRDRWCFEYVPCYALGSLGISASEQRLVWLILNRK